MAQSETDRNRCLKCRYWTQRCCHALALRDHRGDEPSKCHHFTAEASRFNLGQEVLPC